MKQHRQRRNRIARSCCAAMQQSRVTNTRTQRLADVWRIMAGMSVPGQPAQVRGHDRIRLAKQPIVPPPPSRTLARISLELGRVPQLAPLHRTASRLRAKYHALGERRSCRRGRGQDHLDRVLGLGVAGCEAGIPSTVGVEMQRHHVITFIHESRPTCPPVRGRPPPPAQMPAAPCLRSNRRIGLHDWNGLAHACNSDTPVLEAVISES